MLFGKLFTNPKMWVNGDADEITMGGVYTCKDVQNVPTGDGALLVFKTENTVKQVFIPVGEEGVVYTRVLGEDWCSVSGTSEETEALIQSAIDKANQAQAKADTVDTRLNNIIVESGTSEAEVVAARTDSNGQTFTTLGQRLDTQFNEIKEDLNQIEDLENPSMFLTWETGGISVATGEDVENSAYSRISGYIPMESVIKVVNDPSVVGYIYIYEKENDVYTFRNIINLKGEYLVTSSNRYRYLRVAIQNHETQKVQITKNATIIETIEENGMTYNNYLYLENGSLNGNDGKEVAYQYANRTDYITISEFGTLFVNPLYRSAIFVYDSTHTRLNSTQWTNFIKINKDIIYESTNTTAENAVYCRIIFSRALQDSHYMDYLDSETVKQANVYYAERYYHVHRSFYDKKIISIYGDSISTFSGWIPEGNATYYTGSNAGVKNVYDTWWMKTISALGANLLVNNSWSGRAVSSIRDNTSGHETDAGYKEANVLQLKKNDVLPEVIIVKLGINDFNSGAVLGDYDGSGVLPTDPTKFLDAYAIMLNLIMTNFPLAEVYCCTLMQCERSGSIGFPENNSRGNSLGQWNDGIKKLAHAFGAKVLDHDVCGITYYNMSTYMGDYSSGSGLHPNAKGHSLIANQTIHEMDNAVRKRY